MKWANDSLFFSDWGQSHLLCLHNVLPLRTLAENKQISLISPVCLCFLLTLMFTFLHICHLVLCFSMGRNTPSGWVEVTTEHVDIREQKSIYCVCPVVSVCVSVSDGTVSTQQCLCSEKRCLQHVCRLHDQHVFQPAEVLRPQTFIRLHGITWKKRSKSGKSEVLWKFKSTGGWEWMYWNKSIYHLCVTKLGLVIRTGDRKSHLSWQVHLYQ